MHAFFCMLSFVLVYFLYPETRGVPLEEMDKCVSMICEIDRTLMELQAFR